MKSLRIHFFFSSFLLLLLLCSCVQGKVCKHEQHLLELPVDTLSVNASILGEPKNGIINIKDTIDLNHRICAIPAGITLNLKDGVIKNGTLVGNMTEMKSRNACFYRVRILGTWNVPEIKSSLFCDLSYDNSLKDVFALAHPSVYNKIYVAYGDYQVTAKKQSDACITVYSNSDVVLNGIIKLTPNNFLSCDIVKVQGDNINIKGKGVIVGDKHTHTGKGGEWGMGIDVSGSYNVQIKGLTVKDCWGDCIYVGDESSDITIRNCSLDHGRRQGISITSANDVVIKECTIKNVGGTSPEYAIDIEPNRGKTVNNVVINKVTVDDCKGGFMALGRAEGAKIGTVTIKDCVVRADNRPGVNMGKCQKVTIQRCKITQENTARAINCEDIEDLLIVGNDIQQNYLDGIYGLKNAAKKIAAKRLDPIRLFQCGKVKTTNNHCE